MKSIIKILKFYFIVLFIFTITVNNIVSQNSYRVNNFVLSYCYQPLVSGVQQIYCINADGTNNRKIIEASIGLNHQDWSPDTMKYAAVGYIGGGNTTWSIYTFNYNGTGLSRLTYVNNVWDTEPAWSPDMSRISFTRTYPNQNMKHELWVMNSDGSNQHYVGIEGFMAKWSKDGRKFIYTAKKTNSNFDIYTCDTNGINENRLTYSSNDKRFPVYSPDGTVIVFSAGTDNSMTDWEIYKMKSDGTNIRQLTSNNAYEFCAQWSPDGTMFAYGSDVHEAGKWEIYIMDTSGSNVQRVTYSPENITAINPVWRQPLTTKIENLNSIVPDNYKLFQNYPNPFNPVTHLMFSIPKNLIQVKLSVYDIIGRKISTLVDEKLNAGTYKVNFSGENISGGIYFYKLETEGFTETKKMIFLK